MATQGCLHPGGLTLTDQFFSTQPLPIGAKIVDVGCGVGVTGKHLREKHHFSAIGVEKDPEKSKQCKWAMVGEAEQLPFPNESLDGVLFECSLSKISQPATALLEAFRVLKPEGFLYFSDMFAQGKPAQFTGLLGRMDNKQTLQNLFFTAGFTLLHWGEHPNQLQSYWAELLFHSNGSCGQLLPSPGQLKETQCNYCSAVFQKPNTYSSAPFPASPLDKWIYTKTGCSPTSKNLHNWQLKQIGNTVEYAKKNSPFYKKFLGGCSAETIQQNGTLEGLPFTDGETISQMGARMLCTSLGDVARIHTLPTSGSTGAAKRIWFTDEDLQRTVDFFEVGMQQVMGKGKKAVILMSDEKPGSIASLLQEALGKIGVCATIHGALQSQPNFSPAQIENVDCLVGLPTDILYLCRKYPHLKPGSVLVSADYIPASFKATVQSNWNCAVFYHYGMTETGYGLAVQCLAGAGQHIRSADFYVEIVDPFTGKNLPNGQEGEIVLTSLQNKALPLFRYKTGDIGSIAKEPCPCGSVLPRLGKISGRIQNILSPYNIHWLDDILFSDPSVHYYSAKWEKDQLTVQIEGTQLADKTLQHACAAMGVPLNIVYKPICFSTIKGKRKIETF